MKSRVLVVEDNDRIRASLRLALIDEGHDVDDVCDAESALEHLRTDRGPDLALVDVMLPGMSGLDLCRVIRNFTSMPLIIVSARDDSHDVVAGLEAGADDYVTKPYVIKEVAARIRALLRRTIGNLDEIVSSEVVRFGDLSVARSEARVERDGEDVALTRTEFHLLCELIDNPRRVLSRDQLLTTVWGYDHYGDRRVVDAHIGRLRKKIEEDPAAPVHVLTVRGMGYKFDPGPS